MELPDSRITNKSQLNLLYFCLLTATPPMLLNMLLKKPKNEIIQANLVMCSKKELENNQ